MSYPVWPAALPQTPRRQSWSGGAQEARAVFEPEYGPPLTRRRTTAEAEIYAGAVFPSCSDAGRAAFITFWSQDLAGGALPFLMKDPVTGDWARWKILRGSQTPYTFTSKGAGRHDLSLSLMKLPGATWFAPYIPAGTSLVPDLVLDFAAGVYGAAGQRKTFGDIVTFTRSSTATYVNDKGVMKVAAPGEARIAHDPFTRAPLGLLVERASANLIARSHDFTSGWAVFNATLNAGVETGRDGTQTAGGLVESATTAVHAVENATAVSYTAGSVYTVSVYVKRAAGSRHFAMVLSSTIFGVAVGAGFDLDSGVATLGAGGTATAARMERAGGGWWRCSVTAQAASTIVSTVVRFQTTATSTSFNNSYAGDGVSGIYLWGAQIELSDGPTSYIPTALSAGVARSADTANVDPARLPEGLFATGGSLVVDARRWAAQVASAYARVVRVEDGTASDYLSVFVEPGTTVLHTATAKSGSVESDNAHGAVAEGTSFLIALAVAQNDLRSSRGGGAVVRDTSLLLPVLDRMKVGADGVIVNSVAVWSDQLTDAVLQALSA